MTKEFLDAAGLDYEYDDRIEDFIEFLKSHHIKTVPAIWIDGEYIGGYTELIERAKS